MKTFTEQADILTKKVLNHIKKVIQTHGKDDDNFQGKLLTLKKVFCAYAGDFYVISEKVLFNYHRNEYNYENLSLDELIELADIVTNQVKRL